MTTPAIVLGYRRPRHAKQLQSGSPTASTDCGPCAVTVAVQGASEGRLTIPRGDLAPWIAALRRQMTHFAFWPATSLTNHQQALASDLVEGALLGAGRKPPRLVTDTVSHGQIVTWLERGYWLVVGLDYGRLNDLMPALSGSPTFRGGHFVTIGGHARQQGTDWCYLYDSLHDGRRAGIPRGVQTVRVLRYLRAAETFGTPKAGTGRAKVCLVRPGGAL